eukprot:GHVO01005528.1.p1 GENE.GHVO01005528.1~~GHVO01005528.1.p1  ORF type:complete len:234 (-),score=62.10 GHVO01005528.1:1060-1740(-)
MATPSDKEYPTPEAATTEVDKTEETKEENENPKVDDVPAVPPPTEETKEDAKAVTAGDAPEPASQQQQDEYDPEAEVTYGNWNIPQVEVKEIEVVTGEENECIFWSHRAKLFRYKKVDDGPGEWKERGTGDAKLLKDKKTGKIRFLLRQEKTWKVVANHYVLQKEKFCQLVPNVSSEKIWVWTVNDSSEGETVLEQFALKFGQVEQATMFKEKFEDACNINKDLFD